MFAHACVVCVCVCIYIYIYIYNIICIHVCIHYKANTSVSDQYVTLMFRASTSYMACTSTCLHSSKSTYSHLIRNQLAVLRHSLLCLAMVHYKGKGKGNGLGKFIVNNSGEVNKLKDFYIQLCSTSKLSDNRSCTELRSRWATIGTARSMRLGGLCGHVAPRVWPDPSTLEQTSSLFRW